MGISMVYKKDNKKEHGVVLEVTVTYQLPRGMSNSSGVASVHFRTVWHSHAERTRIPKHTHRFLWAQRRKKEITCNWVILQLEWWETEFEKQNDVIFFI